jgi:Na+-driven multidrug efflux pump
MSTPVEAINGTADYLRICFIGIPFITAYNVIASIFRGIGDSKSPMYFVAVACALNILLDFIFIGSMNMGPAGAALGTTLSQTFSVGISLFYLKRKGLGIRFHKHDLRPDRPTLSTILKIGTPIALQDGFIQIAFLAITVIANNRGLVDSAAVGIVEKLIGMLFLVPSAMLSTVSTMTAQNIGAGQAERCRLTLKYAVMIALSYGTLIAILIQFTAEPVVGWFTSDPEVIHAGGQYFRSYVMDTAVRRHPFLPKRIFRSIRLFYRVIHSQRGFHHIGKSATILHLLSEFSRHPLPNGPRRSHRLPPLGPHLHRLLHLVPQSTESSSYQHFAEGFTPFRLKIPLPMDISIH